MNKLRGTHQTVEHRRAIAVAITRHGATGGGQRTREYEVFNAAKQRCMNPKNLSWKNYGGRGIKFLFQSFEQFLAELGLRTSPQHTLDRIDNDGHYEPGNCRWATRKEQLLNRRKVGLIGTFSSEELQRELKKRCLSGDSTDVFAELKRDLAQRDAIGYKEYGGPLDSRTHRDWLQEAYEEVLDLAVYLKAGLMSIKGD